MELLKKASVYIENKDNYTEEEKKTDYKSSGRIYNEPVKKKQRNK